MVQNHFVTFLDLKSKTSELFLFRDLTSSSRKKMQVFTSTFISFENRYVLMLRRSRFITISLYDVYLYSNILEICQNMIINIRSLCTLLDSLINVMQIFLTAIRSCLEMFISSGKFLIENHKTYMLKLSFRTRP